MASSGQRPREVLIAGAGVAALEALLALRRLAGDRVSIDLVAPVTDFEYRPLAVMEPFGGPPAPRLSLGGVVRDHGAGHVFQRLAAVEPEHHRIRTAGGDEYGYETLILATGAQTVDAIPGALSFPGRSGGARFRELLGQLQHAEVRDLVFAVPAQTPWTLPLYELALMTAAWLFNRRVAGTTLTVVTPERAPLVAFGDRASADLGEMLERYGVDLRSQVTPLAVSEGALELDDGRTIPADRVVALPRLVGPAVRGLPADPDGFVPTDEHGRVPGLEDVYAAGDVTTLPMKQGGLATQQADAVAASVAKWAGAPVGPTALRPVLRGVLLTDEQPVHLRADLRPHGTRSLSRLSPLWWPPAKIAGRYLAPYLAAQGISLPEAHAER